jgi:hydroxymethylpyrimidine pyrophosphatase-like HAD family hydrolase
MILQKHSLDKTSLGWIAVDIDGTITLDKYSVPKPVIAYFRDLVARGWRIAVATGRPFRFAAMALSEFDFPYVLLCQNGSVAIAMPQKEILLKRYLTWEAIGLIEQAYDGADGDFIVCMGVDRDDLCYFRPKWLSEEKLSTLNGWQARLESQEFFTPELIGTFPMAKCFGSYEWMKTIASRLRSFNRFEVALMKNPFNSEASIVLVTDADASKGCSLEKVFKALGRGSVVIAAGDDENDISLLRIADIKIAMSHAPDALRELADILAPPTAEMGIIRALQMAVEHGKTGH